MIKELYPIIASETLNKNTISSLSHLRKDFLSNLYNLKKLITKELEIISPKTSNDQSLMVMTNKATFVSIINSEKLDIIQQIIKDMANEYQSVKMKWLIKHEPFNKFITNELLSESMHFISTSALQLIKQSSSNQDYDNELSNVSELVLNRSRLDSI